jgi:hypothetical protein
VLLGYQSWYGDAIARLLRTWNLEALLVRFLPITQILLVHLLI